MSKGQTSYPFTMAEAALTFLLIMGVAYGTQDFTTQFVKEETTEAQVERVKNAAMAVDSLPEGHIEIDLDGYEYKIDGGELKLSFRDTNESIDISESVSVDNIEGADSYTELQGLCISKSDNTIEFSEGEC